MTKLIGNWNARGLSRYLYIWRQASLNEKMKLEASAKSSSIFEPILMDSALFNKCLLDDHQLSQVMASQIMSQLQFHSDFLFLSKETIRMVND
jgi:hypothetical protein